jgi:hypothetical protein
MFQLAVAGNIDLLMFLHSNPPRLNALCTTYEELKKELRFNRMAAERQRWELRGWSFAEGTGAAGSDGTQYGDSSTSQSLE